MTLGPRQLDTLGDIARRDALRDPVIWAELSALGRKRANSLLKRGLISVQDVMRSSGHVHLTDAGRDVLGRNDG